jgi:flavin-binding protein dodecin
MLSHVYKKIEITGTSSSGIEDAIQNAIALASRTVHNMRWLEVTETRAHIEDDQISQWQVTIKVGFDVEQ